MDAHNLATLYDLPTLSWEPVAARLAEPFTMAPGSGGPDRHSTWLTTLDPDGAPHTTGVGAQWIDEAWWFTSGLGARKARNLQRDPRATLALAAREFDLSVTGSATLVTDPADVARLCEVFAAGGWPCRVDDSGTALTAEFSAPSAGPPPWHLFRLVPHSATVLSVVEPLGATRFEFR